MSKLSIEKAALILAESEFSSDHAMAERWGISTKTIQRYRGEAASDPELSENVYHNTSDTFLTWL